ncbi:hypothetical protein C9J12_22620 [Photobacterium frigidiphilum]|uniref:Uncharacterized protein n=1 Tax=Photobacterium frigidiphilum TaxID=264736 RepID=A0A2T3J9L6_9GAMM|nr:hypothetical protein [Photobacterium frigidiphilum]PSU45499.1 hypothetical protein C9J12_22620 [Photobacterium frigidiphilum]
MQKYQYRLYCSECEKVTPHDEIEPERFEPKDIGSSNIYLKAMNMVIGLFTEMLSTSAQTSHYKCSKCGNEFEGYEDTSPF